MRLCRVAAISNAVGAAEDYQHGRDANSNLCRSTMINLSETAANAMLDELSRLMDGGSALDDGKFAVLNLLIRRQTLHRR